MKLFRTVSSLYSTIVDIWYRWDWKQAYFWQFAHHLCLVGKLCIKGQRSGQMSSNQDSRLWTQNGYEQQDPLRKYCATMRTFSFTGLSTCKKVIIEIISMFADKYNMLTCHKLYVSCAMYQTSVSFSITYKKKMIYSTYRNREVTTSTKQRHFEWNEHLHVRAVRLLVLVIIADYWLIGITINRLIVN